MKITCLYVLLQCPYYYYYSLSIACQASVVMHEMSYSVNHWSWFVLVNSLSVMNMGF